METLIVINLQVEGVHRWEQCPFEDVNFLKNNHRHIFHIKCKKKVFHDDREIEIIRLKREIERETKGQFEGKSCEMIAREMLEKWNLDYCEVLEDGENGAEVWK